AIVAAGQNPTEGFRLPPEVVEMERQNAFWDKLNAETDLQKKLVLLEAEYARIKDTTTDAEYLKRIEDSLKACRYTQNPAAMAAAMTSAMEEQKKKLMEEAGIKPEILETKGESPQLSESGVCPGCGATNQTSKFCEFCGTKIGN
ncbi:MAG: hypothetical protein J6N32_09595, partial [Clostridia bacterium]|nr:hypothetical protein [Clostridia bacterium]